MNYANYIKKTRTFLGLSQAYVAKELDISRPTYIQIENGERELTMSECEKLAALFNMSINDFLEKAKPSQKVTVVMEDKKKIEKIDEIRISVPQERKNKFKEVLLYILNKVGAKPNVGETVIYKLLYFIDFDFYEKYEEQLIGARYQKNIHGPTPVEFKKIIDEMEKEGEIIPVKSKYFKYMQKKYLPRIETDLKNLSAREIKHIDEVLTRLSDKNANELSEYSHNDVPYITAENGQIIDYEAVFYRTERTSVRKYEED